MIVFEDQMKRKITLNENPKRIVSLVPSQTELLFDLGLNEEVIGITKFCVHPSTWFQTKTRIGGTKNINLKKIDQLKPNLIIGNKEENDRLQIEELSKHYNVWMSDVKTLHDALQMILNVGTLTGKEENAEAIIQQIKINFESISKLEKNISVAYLIWYDPYMVVGCDTFINEMMLHCQFKNAFENFSRYAEVTIEQLQHAKPDYIFLSSEPFPFKQKHVEQIQKLLPKSKISIVDGEMFSWYGSRLIYAPEYFNKVISKVSSNR